MPRLVGIEGLAAGTMFQLSMERVLIGRDGESDIALMDNTVSLQHAAVIRDENGRFSVRDLDSTNGVYVNHQRVQQAVLADCDSVKIGESVFRYEL